MENYINEATGFKVVVGGFSAWFASILQGVDLTQVIGFIGLVIGLIIQIISFYRNQKQDKRDKEADDRSKAQYDLQMKVLAGELKEVEQRIKNGSNS